MLVFNLIGWWYGAGFLVRLKGLGRRLGRTADAFSIGLNFKTLFNPFRQIDAGARGRGPAEMMQAFLSRLISRFVGLVMRLGLIIFGSMILLVQLVLSVAVAVLHLAVPVLPVCGIVLMAMGWLPLEIKLW